MDAYFLKNRAVNTGLVVHHVDGNLSNNSPENLQLMSRDEHVQRTKPKKPKSGDTRK